MITLSPLATEKRSVRPVGRFETVAEVFQVWKEVNSCKVVRSRTETLYAT